MIEVTAAALAAHPFLHGMSHDHLTVLADAASDVTFPAKHRLFEDGHSATRFWLIQSGHVTLDLHVPGQGLMSIETIGMGELLGWSWLFPPYQVGLWRRGRRPRRGVRVRRAHGAGTLRRRPRARVRSHASGRTRPLQAAAVRQGQADHRFHPACGHALTGNTEDRKSRDLEAEAPWQAAEPVSQLSSTEKGRDASGAAGPRVPQSGGIGTSITGTSASRTVRRTAAARPGPSRCDHASAIMSACPAPATFATCSAAAPLRSSSRAPGSAQ